MNHKKQFLKFVVPSIVSMLVFNLYTMIDGIYVARFVGEKALSAVNIAMPYINFIFTFSILFLQIVWSVTENRFQTHSKKSDSSQTPVQ